MCQILNLKFAVKDENVPTPEKRKRNKSGF